jgi:hypothetical protein
LFDNKEELVQLDEEVEERDPVDPADPAEGDPGLRSLESCLFGGFVIA